jgi:hypothetical protein
VKFLDNLFRQSNYEPSDNWHEDFIVHVAQILKPQVYVELGIYRASLFDKMAKVAGECHGVDHNPDSARWVTPSPNAHFYRMTTNEFSYELKHLPGIDMLFIDAGHDAESVVNDFCNYSTYVRQDGIIFIHDTYPRSREYTGAEYCGNGYKAIERLKQMRGFEMMTIPKHPGLTICRKSNHQVMWDD